MKYELITTGELQTGDRINNYGMILRIDQGMTQLAHRVDETRGPVLWSRALVENWDEVQRLADDGDPTMQYLRSFIRSDMSPFGLRAANGHCPDTEPRWTIQGNNWARWSRIVEED